MLKIIEYTLVSVDGVFANPGVSAFMGYRDDAYMRDGLAALMGAMRCRWAGGPMKTLPRWPGQGHPWADGLNSIKKYVLSSRLKQAYWNNSAIIRGDVVDEATKLKQRDGGNLLVYGHGLLGETLLRRNLLNVLDVSIHLMFVGSGKRLFCEGEQTKLKLVATKTFSNL
jgi:hypothetical protein